MPNAFYPSLHEFCTKYYVQGPKPLTVEDQIQFPVRAIKEQAALFEHLLLFDTLAIKIYGENVELAVLLRTYLKIV